MPDFTGGSADLGPGHDPADDYDDPDMWIWEVPHA
jgi:hypothetical protein